MGNDATECQKESQAGVIEGTLRKPRRDPVSFPPGQQQNHTLVRLEPEAEADFTQESILHESYVSGRWENKTGKEQCRLDLFSKRIQGDLLQYHQ